ncbi:hypothetical protein DLAC_02880 [Tieghemostelium lacteum]|uniref:Uncharacterized protein n=1 Tax=Tieghemostelium lacteum TaxID=361077 RepID=A0A152A3K5_TIELA|nr:hypothetical protein DLAC_02880 [Tieghemostelium lacteum]|eukprot:KYR00828.1 hypothetical protein DLAC_02880 [Tieghemostelium lacteum]
MKTNKIQLIPGIVEYFEQPDTTTTTRATQKKTIDETTVISQPTKVDHPSHLHETPVHTGPASDNIENIIEADIPITIKDVSFSEFVGIFFTQYLPQFFHKCSEKVKQLYNEIYAWFKGTSKQYKPIPLEPVQKETNQKIVYRLTIFSNTSIKMEIDLDEGDMKSEEFVNDLAEVFKKHNIKNKKQD